jgi:hypothetical protein
MAVSPVWVAIGVSGDAQTGGDQHTKRRSWQTPSTHAPQSQLESPVQERRSQ